MLALAKINLTLEVLGKRPDGFHEIRSVVQTISLCDTLDFEIGTKVTIESSLPGWSARESLVARASALLQEVTGCSKGATITVTKRIPLTSGLGGDSSDAAATLRGLNELWGLHLSGRELLELAPRLGSDVAVLLHGGTALASGRGEVVTPLPPMPRTPVIIVMPSLPRPAGKTAQLYASLNPNHHTDGQITSRLAEALRQGEPVRPSMLFNTFENVAFDCFSGLAVYREHMAKLGADHVHLAGSGPALFTLATDKAHADDLYSRYRQQGLEAYLAYCAPQGR